MSQEPYLTIGAVARCYGCPVWHIRRLGARGIIPPTPCIDEYRIFLPIRLGWFRFHLRFRARGMPRHLALESRITVGGGVEDFNRLVNQGIAASGELPAIVPLDLHPSAVSPDDAALAPSLEQRMRRPDLSVVRLVLKVRGDLFLLLLLCLLGVATLLVGRLPDTSPRFRQDSYLTIVQGPQGNTYRFALLVSRMCIDSIGVLPSRGGHNTQTLIAPN